MKSRQILKTFLASSLLVILTGCYADLQKADSEMQITGNKKAIYDEAKWVVNKWTSNIDNRIHNEVNCI